jgi:hypothetical protein
LTPQKKRRKVGRPKLPKGVAKGRIVPVRFSGKELKVVEKAAKTEGLTISEWIRAAIAAWIKKKK